MPPKKQVSFKVKNPNKKSVNGPFVKKKAPTPFRDVGTVLGGAAGSMLGFGSVGRSLGGWLGSKLGSVFGSGAYKLRQNNLMAGNIPVMHTTSETVRFRKREYIGDISSSTTFVQTTYAVNPGVASSFPYLSAIAQNFQEYKFHGLIYEFRSTSADALNSTNTALGTISMAAQYRADATAFLDKQQLLNEMWSVDVKPSECVILPVECSPKENSMGIQYIRGATVPAGQDTKLYDLAKVTVASYGSQAAAVVGELWVSYDVELFKPQLSAGVDLYGNSYVAYSTNYTNSLPFGTTTTVVTNGVGIYNAGANLQFPVGTQGLYLITAYWVGSSTSCTIGAPSLTNCTAITIGGLSNPYSVANATTTTYVLAQVIINITDSTLAAKVVWTGSTLPASGTNSAYVVTQLSDSFVST